MASDGVNTKPQQQQGFNKKKINVSFTEERTCKNPALGRHNLDRREQGDFFLLFLTRSCCLRT